MYQPKDPRMLFWRHVKKTRGCWIWTGAKDPKGYGKFCSRRKNFFAHRFAWISEVGPTDLLVCHRCDNPACVRPSHLFVGTQADNLRDMFAKGRAIVGENHHGAKLTSAKVRELRRLRDEGMEYAELGERFGVSMQSAWDAAVGRTWGHVS